MGRAFRPANQAAVHEAPWNTERTSPVRHFRSISEFAIDPEFQRVYDKGQRFRARLMTVMALANGRDVSRLGIAATRKQLGDAVNRNRAKRLVREAFRRADLPAGLDIVVIPRADMLDAEFSTLESELRYVLRRLLRR